MNRITMRYVQAKCLLGLLLGMALRWIPHRRPLWIIGERGTDARDNGKWFFLFLIEKLKVKSEKSLPEVVYFITNDSPDRTALNSQFSILNPRLTDPRGFRAHYLLGRCDLIVSTQWRFYRYTSPLFMGNTLGKWLLKHFMRKQVFLQHGICKNMVRSFTYEFAPFDLFICGAQQEYEYIKAEFGFPTERVVYTGLCRFDRLHEFKTKRQILVIPTWRSWFNGMSLADFNQSEYCLTYNTLLQNEELYRLLEKQDITLIFFPHHDAQRYISAFTAPQAPIKGNETSASISPTTECRNRIIIAKERDYDIQQLMKESLLMVTDFSSVYFDFAYMRKPFIHFVFDKQRYETEHYAPGYYDFEDGLGYCAHDIPELIETIKHSAALGFRLEEKYEHRITDFYPLYDTNNCQRVYDAIKNAGL